MKPRDALVLALRDFYANSWRLVAVNAAFGAVVVASVLAALALPIAGVLIAAAGPAAAVMVHCSVTLVRTGNLAFADAWEGLRLHWRRGVVLSVLGCALLGTGCCSSTLLRRNCDLATRVSDAVPPRSDRDLRAHPVDARDRRAGVRPTAGRA